MNRAMHRKLRDRRAIYLSDRPREGNYYVLDRVVDGMDYCNPDTDTWIWSIGRRLADDVILASATTDLYQNPEFE